MKTDSFKKGDILRVKYTLFTHYGIYAGNNSVIHYSGLVGNGKIEKTSLVDFEDGRTAEKIKVASKFSKNETVKRATLRLGEDKYNAVTNNCEHFVQWACNGKHKSNQVRKAAMALSAIAIGVLKKSNKIRKNYG